MRALSLLLLFAPSVALADPVFDRVVDEQSDRFATELGTKWSSASERQALTRALVDSRLLETLNRFDAAPKTGGALDEKALTRVGVLDQGGRRYTFLFAGQELSVMMARIAVPVIPDRGEGWSKDRLSRRVTELEALKRYQLVPIHKDRYGNVFRWRGKARGGRVFVEHRPERDELVVVFVRR